MTKGNLKAEIEQDMAELKATIYRLWIEGERANSESAEQKAERYRLTDRWYELRRQLRSGETS